MVGSETISNRPASTSGGRLELLLDERGEEADAAEVDAHHRHAGVEEPLERAQHRAVAAQHDGDVGRHRPAAVERACCLVGARRPRSRALEHAASARACARRRA